MNEVLVAAPHPDDETLGCAGALLRHKANGDRLHWLTLTGMRQDYGFEPAAVRSRDEELRSIAERLGFATVHHLGFPPARLDTIAMSEIIERVGSVVRATAANVVYAPYRGDAHTDHAVTFDAVAACAKWFRFPNVRRLLAYETLSETEASLDPTSTAFRPNVFVDISAFLEEKVSLVRIYRSELGEFPFPRSETAIRALAAVRGAAGGFSAAEAFMLLLDRG